MDLIPLTTDELLILADVHRQLAQAQAFIARLEPNQNPRWARLRIAEFGQAYRFTAEQIDTMAAVGIDLPHVEQILRINLLKRLGIAPPPPGTPINP